MTASFVPNDALADLFGSTSDLQIAAPAATDTWTWLDCDRSQLSAEALARPRAVQSPKGFFMPPAESVGRYGADDNAATAVEAKPLVVVGARACELRAQAYIDKVMLGGEFEDPAYRQRREATTVVTCDCVDCAETCFCTLVGGKPFAEDGFDVNMTALPDGVLVEAATDKGNALLEGLDLAAATDEQIAQRDEIRQAMIQRVTEQNASLPLTADDDSPPGLPEGDGPGWQTFAADCVECAACTHICPTCHCFYLYDQAVGAGGFERMRTWDSCLLSTYHRMAGGPKTKASPRPKLAGRLANRVLHKFVYSPQQYQLLGCVGCGRCIEACLGEIDIRKVVCDLSATPGEAAK